MKILSPRAALLAGSLFVLTLLSGCLAPRLTATESAGATGQDVLARFMRTENRENSPLLSQMLALDFKGRPQSNFQQYVVSKGGTCSLLGKVLTCLYRQMSPAQLSRPLGSAPAALLQGTSTRAFTMMSVGATEGWDAKVVDVKVRIELFLDVK